MRVMTRILLLVVAVIAAWFGLVRADEGNITDLRAYVAANPQARWVFIGSSSFQGDAIRGRYQNTGANGPYDWPERFADSLACHTSDICHAIARRVGTNRFAVIAVGGIQTVAGDDPPTSEQADSSLYGFISSTTNELYRPDVVVIDGITSGNDHMTGGKTYAQIRAQLIASAAKAVNEFRGKWVVYLGPRLAGINTYTRQDEGSHAANLAAAITLYDTLDDLGVFISDTLRTEVAALGHNVSKFVTFDTKDYWALADADTAGILTDSLELVSQAEYNSAKHIKFSPLNWYQPDGYHLNLYGAHCFGDSIAKYLFGATLDDSYTHGTGATIYVDGRPSSTGHNWAHRMDCQSQSTPLRTLQAALCQAHPGDIIQFLGAGSHSATAYDSTSSTWVGMTRYEAMTRYPGITIRFQDGGGMDAKYVSGTAELANGLTTVGQNILNPYSCGDGSPSDSLSHASSAEYLAAKVYQDLDLKIEGGYFQGYQNPFLLYNTGGITWNGSTLIGGASNFSIRMINWDQVVEFDMTDCTVYADSSSLAANTAYGGIELGIDTTGTVMSETCRYTGTVRGTQFIGRAAKSSQSPVLGGFHGIDWIECEWDDPKSATYAFMVHSGANTKAGTEVPRMRIINCRLSGGDPATATVYGIGWGANHNDSLYVINCAFDLRSTTNAHAIYHSTNAPGATGITYVAGSCFKKFDYPSGRTDPAPPATFASPDYITRSHLLTAPGGMSAESDTVYFGGVISFAGYDLDDFGVEHGRTHASIGNVQYTDDPIIWTSGAVQGQEAYATMAGPWEVLKLVNQGILATSSATNPDTWFDVPRLYNESDLAVARSFLDAWEKWPAAAQAKVRFRVLAEPVTTIKSSDSTYQTLGQLDAALTAAAETASDSLDASTWFTLPRPYNLNAAFQIEVMRAWYRSLAEANRKKIRFRVASTDFSLLGPDSTYSQGLWAALADIGGGATASDSLDASTWFQHPRVYDMAQAQQTGIYRDAWQAWPDSTRKKMRFKTL